MSWLNIEALSWRVYVQSQLILAELELDLHFFEVVLVELLQLDWHFDEMIFVYGDYFQAMRARKISCRYIIQLIVGELTNLVEIEWFFEENNCVLTVQVLQIEIVNKQTIVDKFEYVILVSFGALLAENELVQVDQLGIQVDGIFYAYLFASYVVAIEQIEQTN